MNYYPDRVKIERVPDSNDYILKPKHDGYYWCAHVNTTQFKATESKKTLFIREKASLINFYAIKLKHAKVYSTYNVEPLLNLTEMRLKEYIYLRTKYESVYGDLDANVTEEVLRRFHSDNYFGIEWKENSAILKPKIKRLYVDRRSMLVHVKLHHDMRPVTPGVWKDIEILFMKPVFYCKGFDSVRQHFLGK